MKPRDIQKMTLFSPRWSTLGLLVTGSLTGLLGFYGRGFFRSAPSTVATPAGQLSLPRPPLSAGSQKTSTASDDSEDRSTQLLTQEATLARDQELISVIE